jgi:hypothetical protein
MGVPALPIRFARPIRSASCNTLLRIAAFLPRVSKASGVVDSAISIFYNDMADLVTNPARKERTCRSLTIV